MSKAIEAAQRALDEVLLQRNDVAVFGTHDAIKEAIAAYLAAMKAEGFVMARAEPVHGANIDEWRTNISLDLYRSGDLVLAWVNQGDINAALLSATQHDDGGE